MQSLALDVRVLDKEGQEIELSELCNDEDNSSYTDKVDMSAIDEVLGDHVKDNDELKDSFLVENSDGEIDEEFFDDSFEDDMSDDDDFADEAEDMI